VVEMRTSPTTSAANVISPHEEMIAYETLWGNPKATLKTIADRFRAHPTLPSELLSSEAGLFPNGDLRSRVEKHLSSKRGFSVAIFGSYQYPQGLRDASHPIELFYYRGDIGLTESRCVSVVGTRTCTKEGMLRARKIARELVKKGFTVVSGLARGIDTAAMKEVLRVGGSLIGVIGTPIDQSYPEENRDLQEIVAKDHLLISQVPFYRYEIEHFQSKKRHFPERNQTMSALSEATVIVEASDHSGTLTQARACLEQGRKLFILESCFQNRLISWPAHYEKKGAVRVRTVDDILKVLGDASR
jgi:DNA processing protein